MSDEKRLCIIIPAFNEATVIGNVVRDVIKSFAVKPWLTTVVVVDDHSTDQTQEEAQAAGAVVVRHVINTGAGGATATGLAYARSLDFDLAACMDADGQHLSIDVERGVEELAKRRADLLIGSRLIDSQGMSKAKVVGNRGLSLFTWALFGIKATDSQSGLRIFSRRAIERLNWKSSGFEFCSEMLWRAKQAGLVIDEYPIQAVYTDYSKSKGQNNWNGINIVKSLLKRRIGEILQ